MPRVILNTRVRPELKGMLPQLAGELGIKTPSRLVEWLIERAVQERAMLAEQGTEQLGAVRNGG